MISNEQNVRMGESKRVELTFDIIDIWMDQLRFI